MPKNPFLILGIDENCTQNELYDRYKELRGIYSNQRFEMGEKGEEACRKLDELEQAYADAKEIMSNRFEVKDNPNDLSQVETAMKNGNLDEAQRILDNCQSRSAHWHYLQSAVFYKKSFYVDSLKQLEYACAKDPTNIKYQEAKKVIEDKLKANDANRQQGSFYNGNNAHGEQGRTYRNMPPQQQGMDVCNCCSTLICADCCCECCGGDLISCC